MKRRLSADMLAKRISFLTITKLAELWVKMTRVGLLFVCYIHPNRFFYRAKPITSEMIGLIIIGISDGLTIDFFALCFAF